MVTPHKTPLPKELAPIADYLLPLEALSPLTPPPMVYLLLGPSDEPGAHRGEDAVLYVGKTTNFRYRLRRHRVEKAFKRLVWMPLAERELAAVEAAIFDRYSPPLNSRDRHRPDDDAVAVASAALGLTDNGRPPPWTASNLPDFHPDMAEKLWYRLSWRARLSLRLVARARTYDERRRGDKDFNFRTMFHVRWVARTACRAKAPFTIYGPVRGRIYSMEPEVAKAILKAARRLGM